MANITDYELGQELGRGSFAVVYKAKKVSTGAEVAIKQIQKKGYGKLLHISVKGESILVVVDFCNMGDLHQYLRGRTLSLDEVHDIFSQFAAGLEFLHENNIFHRDLKPQNILLHRTAAGLNVRIADFGFARFVGSSTDVFTSILGSPLYMAPEMHANTVYDQKTDLWSAGIILYELVYGRTPFTARSQDELKRELRAGQINFPPNPKLDENPRGPACRDLLQRLLQHNAAQRIDWPQFLAHAFLAPAGQREVFDLVSQSLVKVSWGETQPVTALLAQLERLTGVPAASLLVLVGRDTASLWDIRSPDLCGPATGLVLVLDARLLSGAHWPLNPALSFSALPPDDLPALPASPSLPTLLQQQQYNVQRLELLQRQATLLAKRNRVVIDHIGYFYAAWKVFVTATSAEWEPVKARFDQMQKMYEDQRVDRQALALLKSKMDEFARIDIGGGRTLDMLLDVEQAEARAARWTEAVQQARNILRTLKTTRDELHALRTQILPDAALPSLQNRADLADNELNHVIRVTRELAAAPQEDAALRGALANSRSDVRRAERALSELESLQQDAKRVELVLREAVVPLLQRLWAGRAAAQQLAREEARLGGLLAELTRLQADLLPLLRTKDAYDSTVDFLELLQQESQKLEDLYFKTRERKNAQEAQTAVALDKLKSKHGLGMLDKISPGWTPSRLQLEFRPAVLSPSKSINAPDEDFVFVETDTMDVSELRANIRALERELIELRKSKPL